MSSVHIGDRLVAAFDGLSPQLQQAARFMLDHGDDVALRSMRAVADAAGVHPTTMVRLAKALGFASYNDLKAGFQQKLRGREDGYAARARALQAKGGDQAALLQSVLGADLDNLQTSFTQSRCEALMAAAEVLDKADRVFVLGLRGSFPAAYQFYYAYHMMRSNARLLEGRAGNFADLLRTLGADDVLFAVCFAPYTLNTVRAVQYAAEQRVQVVVLTDSPVSPIARYGAVTLLAADRSPSFFQSFTAATALVQALVAVLVARGGQRALADISHSEDQLARFDAYWQEAGGKRPR